MQRIQHQEPFTGIREKWHYNNFMFLLQGIVATDDANVAFKDADYALLVGAMPRGPGMERSDLLKKNAEIFSVQGQAMNNHANKDIKVLVVGNPANTNALIAQQNAPDINPGQFTAMVRLDHNRALAQMADKLSVGTHELSNMTIWGNHSSTQYPDISQLKVKGDTVSDIDQDWYVNDFIPTVQQRGAAIIKARGASSAASAASAAIDHMKSWALGTKDGDWVSMAIPSDGSYGIEPGVIFGYPVTCANGQYSIVQDLPVSEFSQQRIDATNQELREERAAVEHLFD